MAEKFDQETLDILMKDNEINEEKFKEFHKKIFEEMVHQSLFLARNIFLKKGERPGVGDFNKKLSDLNTDFLSEKIKMLGSYFKK